MTANTAKTFALSTGNTVDVEKYKNANGNTAAKMTRSDGVTRAIEMVGGTPMAWMSIREDNAAYIKSLPFADRARNSIEMADMAQRPIKLAPAIIEWLNS